MNASLTHNKAVRFYAALYMRLSREDGESSESASIDNQRKILINYAKDNGLFVYDEYIDDGYTGTNFDRPSFLRMKQDIVQGKIGVVLTKDFSRLGRNTGQVMMMLDDFFVENGVRYISITEGIDTTASDASEILAPMLSFTNELYAGDISRKINSSFAAKMREGEFVGAFAPYGYRKDPKNKNHLLPDVESSQVVIRIFFLAKEGYSPNQIAKQLNDDGIITPSKYRFKVNIHLDEENYETSDKWQTGTVSKLLRNEVYLGHTLQGKTHKPSFKSKHIENIPKDEWIRVENTHEALIESDTWDIVRKKMQSRTKVREKGFANLFSGVAKCSDCKRNMSTVGTNKKGAKANLNCGGYKQLGPTACTSHFIDYDVLYNIVLEALRQQISFTEEERERLLNEMLQSGDAYISKLDDAKRKLSGISNKLEMVYDKSFSGDIDDKTFENLRAKYELEKESLESVIAEKEKAISIKADTKALTKRHAVFKKLIADYEKLSYLDSEIIFKLIDRIDVHQGEYAEKTKHQRIDIYFKFNCEPNEIIIEEPKPRG